MRCGQSGDDIAEAGLHPMGELWAPSQRYHPPPLVRLCSDSPQVGHCPCPLCVEWWVGQEWPVMASMDWEVADAGLCGPLCLHQG